MTRAALLLCVAALAAPALAGETAFVEIEAVDSCFVQETVRVRLRFGLDAEYFATNVIQPFRQELEVPVRLQAPWLRELPGAVSISAPDDDVQRVTYALNDDVARALRVDDADRDGRRFAVYEVERTYRLDEPGDVELSAPLLQYSYATRFEEDFVNGRVALDPETASVPGAPLTITVRPLPEADRPDAFTGGVGRFTVRAAVTPNVVAAGGTLKLSLTIAGEGNLAGIDAPRLDALAGFHVYGAIDDIGATTRTITYDISPQDATVTEIPAIPFAYFDPAPPTGYRTIHTAPIEIVVHANPDGRFEPEPPDVALPGTAGAFGAWLSLTLVGLVAGALALLLGLGLLLRRNRRRRLDALAATPDPPADFRARIAAPGRDVTEAFVQYLAARLDCPPAAVIDPGLRARLAAAGVPADLAARTAELTEALVAARYGGGSPEGSAAAASALVDDLEKHLSVATPMT